MAKTTSLASSKKDKDFLIGFVVNKAKRRLQQQ
jgi:hypothetical protein